MSQAPHTPQPTHIDDGVFGKFVIGFWRHNGVSARAGLIIAACVSCIIFGLGSQWMQIPALAQFDGSLLLQSSGSPAASILCLAILLLVATLVGTVLAGAVRFEAGLFAASFGMMMVSFRCGTMRSTVFDAGMTNSTWLTLAGEELILTALLVAAWVMLWQLGKAKLVRWPHAIDPLDEQSPDVTGVARIIATFMQMILTAVLAMLLCASDGKNQCIASVGLASVAGAFVAYTCVPTRPSLWFWIGPPLVGAIGYALQAGSSAHAAVQLPSGFFANLSYPLPLDWASVGPAGAILGYWMARRKEVET